MKSLKKTLWSILLPLFLLTITSCGGLIPPSTATENTNPTPVPIVQTTSAPPLIPVATPSSVVYVPPNIVDVVSKVRPAVVSIVTQSVSQSFFFGDVPQRGAGSGIIFTSDGYILTNNHVVDGAQNITVVLPFSSAFPDGESFPGKIVGADSLTDLAVIKVDANNLPTIPFGDSEKLQLGEWVVAIGNAEDLPGGPTVTQGIVSALGRSITTSDRITRNELIQTDAAINPGNSGGPLVNMAGEVVGINSAILASAQNIGFAVSSATAVPVRDQLVKYGKVTWPWLGISGATLTTAIAAERGLTVTKGVLLDSVFRGSPADKAGLRRNDVIIAFGADKTNTIEQLQKAIRKRQVGDKADITYIRGKDTQTESVGLGEMPAQPK
ncbi:MAG: serine protease Do [Dehalococcoidia bacterium]|nr:serine protease Do [Dehalococcoidia bacterium]